MQRPGLVFPRVVSGDLRLLLETNLFPIDVELGRDDHVTAECYLRRCVSECSVVGAADSEGAVGKDLREVWFGSWFQSHIQGLCSGSIVDDAMDTF